MLAKRHVGHALGALALCLVASAEAKDRYLVVVEDYADALLSHGHAASPLLPVILDRHSLQFFDRIGVDLPVTLRDALFSMPLRFEANLNASRLSRDLRRAFREGGIRLSRHSEVIGEGRIRFLFPGERSARDDVESWRIIDRRRGRTYSIVKDDVEQNLAVFFETVNGFDKSDRHAMLHAANPMLDQNVYQILFALSEINNDVRYRDAASFALQWFFENAVCEPDATRLPAWGDHVAWDLRRGSATPPQPERSGRTHEYARPWVLWDQALRVAPLATREIAHDVWTYQVRKLQQRLSDADAIRFRVPPGSPHFSRHALCDGRPLLEDRAEFPRHGGFYIATWAAAIETQRDPELVDAVMSLAEFYQSRRFTISNAPRPNDVGAIRYRTALPLDVVPAQNLSLAIDLWESADKMPGVVNAERLRAIALESDAVLTRDDVTTPGGNYWLDAMVVRKTSGFYHEPWPENSSRLSQAAIGMMLWKRFEHLEPTYPSMATVYRTFAVSVADAYNLASERADFISTMKNEVSTILPRAFGNAILLTTAVCEDTGDTRYLEGAKRIADASLRVFFDRRSPLPKASNRNLHYEATTGADTLMMGLIKLWIVEHAATLIVSLEPVDR